LYEAHLINKDDPVISLVEANLQGANLYGAYLEGAYLRGANLQEAKLSLANLHGAFLREVLGLTQEQIEQAIGDEGTTLPERITRPRSWSSHTDEPTEEE
jgi:uncharacterized protein YjbI with pentapeptide repeats